MKVSLRIFGIGSMSHVHQSCLSTWLTKKHQDMLNDSKIFDCFIIIGCAYPWRILPPIKCKICKCRYNYSFSRKLKIRKSDFNLVFLVMAQIIIFMMDLFYNTENNSISRSTVNGILNSSCENPSFLYRTLM